MVEETQQPRMLLAGVVGAPRGLRGEVSVELRTDQPELRFQEGAVFHTESAEFPTLTVEGFSLAGGKARAFFTEVQTREAAEAINRAELLVREEGEDDAWYPHELEGLAVEDEAGRLLGTVLRLQLGAAQDRLEIESGDRIVDVPFVKELVPVVDTAARKIIVVPLAGLFDGGAEDA